jgi:hypothetical protein
MLADSLFPAVSELVQGEKVGDITYFLIRKGGQTVATMCESVQAFTGIVMALESATDLNEEMRSVMARQPQKLAQDGVDYIPPSSPISLFER